MVVVVVVSRCLRVQVSRGQRLHFAHGRAACGVVSADMAPLSRRLAAAGGKAGGGSRSSRALSARESTNASNGAGPRAERSTGEAGSGAPPPRMPLLFIVPLRSGTRARRAALPTLRVRANFVRRLPLPPTTPPQQEESAVTFSSCGSPAFRSRARVRSSLSKGAGDNHNSAHPRPLPRACISRFGPGGMGQEEVKKYRLRRCERRESTHKKKPFTHRKPLSGVSGGFPHHQ